MQVEQIFANNSPFVEAGWPLCNIFTNSDHHNCKPISKWMAICLLFIQKENIERVREICRVETRLGRKREEGRGGGPDHHSRRHINLVAEDCSTVES